MELIRKYIQIFIQWIMHFFVKPQIESQETEEKKEAEYTSAQLALYNAIQPGDVITAWLPFPEDVMKQIPDEHQKRPYFVIYKGNGRVTAYAGTTKEGNPETRVRISRDEYNIWKEGYMNLAKVHKLHIGDLIDQRDRLHYGTIEEAQHKIRVMRNNNPKGYYPYFKCDTGIRTRSVINVDGQMYFVTRLDRNIHAVPLYTYRTNDSDSRLTIAGMVYYFRQSNDVTLPEGTEFNIITRSYDLSIERLPKKVSQPLKSSEPADPVIRDPYYEYPIGTIFEDQMGDQIIYLFTSEYARYGVPMASLNWDKLIVDQFSLHDLKMKGLADDETMTFVLNYLLDKKPEKYKFLNDLLMDA